MTWNPDLDRLLDTIHAQLNHLSAPDRARILQGLGLIAETPRTWVIADPHLGQGEMTWDGRPADHSERTIQLLRSHLQPGDTLINLGDVVYSRLPREEQSRWLGDLHVPGTHHVMLRGNHDKQSAAWYATRGVILLESIVIGGVYCSHLGTRTLPDDATFQILGHYHGNPAHPDLPHALKLSHTEEQFRPVLLGELVRRADAAGLRRALPPRVDDSWHRRASVLGLLDPES